MVMDELQEPTPQAALRLRGLKKPLAETPEFAAAVAILRSGKQATLDGVWGSACALVGAALAEASSGPLLIVLPLSAGIDDLFDEVRLFGASPVFRFPSWETDRRDRLAGDEIHGQRLATLKSLPHCGPGAIVVTSVVSLLQPVASREELDRKARKLRVGDTLDLESLAKWMATNRFHATSAVELPGEFSIRGGLLDVYAPDWMDPVRIELFGDQVESIRRFQVASQRSLESLKEVEITALGPTEEERSHLAEHLPAGSWIAWVEPQQQFEEAKKFLERNDNPDEVHGYGAMMGSLAGLASVSVSGLAEGGAEDTRLPIQSIERFSGDVSKVREELDVAGTGQHVFLIAQTEAEIVRLREIFAGTKLAAEERLHYVPGRLKSGFRLLPASAVVVSGNELFHRTELRRTLRRQMAQTIDSFLELRDGDLVVHLSHGIARYRGLKTIEKQGQIEEHLELEFHGGTKIFVPATKIDLVQKYVGGNKARPTLAKLGGKTWVRQKEAAAEAVTDLAADLIELQAMREARPGIAFGPDTDWQREFDAAFPYEETTDQLSAIAAIKGDMQRARPMDRLLCGDVGFGKTELAMRAAFKAVDHGYQVAVLVPTTILAEQHYRTFRERMAEFPFTIGKLSRFASAADQKKTLEGLESGGVDVVIGTHRLASLDVKFENIGLVIIDEEQRFGVEVKEKLKTLRAAVDVLTMTATPIPRTLHMSLVGLRDISNLETPPQDRVAVETRVTRFDKQLIRHAIVRELNRGGQVYFVHNRVNDIEQVAQRLQSIVPEATIRIGHGQMHEHDLEQVMVDFVDHKFDILLATTIIESGLDIPNANTIFIDEADRYGLSDLHQLRGRVGRYKHRAYCYLLVETGKLLTPTAAKRLRAIEEFSQLGAGFALSMRDLEIRGAGNILGTEQSGHIAAVGYELYCQLLEDAVRRMKRMPPRVSLEVQLDLPGEAYFPRDYVPDIKAKMDLYRRMCRIVSEQQLADFEAEMIDRFGAVPPPVNRLLTLAGLKVDAAHWRIASIHHEPGFVVFTYTDPARIAQLARRSPGKLRIVDDKSAYLRLPDASGDPDGLLAQAKSLLRQRATDPYNPPPQSPAPRGKKG